MKENMSSFSLVDEQAEFIVINKAANSNFHDEGELGQGLFNQVALSFPHLTLYPVHRLDKMTSGLVLFAKTLTAAQHFQTIFENHQIEKFYLAISAHKPKKKQGLIKGDMEKSRRGMWKLMRTMNNPATTQFFSYGLGEGLRLYILKPHSGKTHQIRVALNSLSATILGDPLYEPKILDKHKHVADRGYLHAYALKFLLNNQPFQYILPPTEGQYFSTENCVKQLEEVKQPWLLNWPSI